MRDACHLRHPDTLPSLLICYKLLICYIIAYKLLIDTRPALPLENCSFENFFFQLAKLVTNFFQIVLRKICLVPAQLYFSFFKQ